MTKKCSSTGSQWRCHVLSEDCWNISLKIQEFDLTVFPQNKVHVFIISVSGWRWTEDDEWVYMTTSRFLDEHIGWTIPKHPFPFKGERGETRDGHALNWIGTLEWSISAETISTTLWPKRRVVLVHQPYFWEFFLLFDRQILKRS